MKTQVQYYLGHLRHDFSASIVVFLVALPLCLGIALASGAPLFSGIISGMVGGVIVSWFSRSQLSVSGPAAGLTVIVFTAIETLGDFNIFLLSLTIAGVLQFFMGVFRAGSIAAFFPAAVIKGMLAAIGMILIIKQIPHATGYDASYVGDESYMQETARSSFFELSQSLHGVSQGATLISIVSIIILIIWDSGWIRRNAWLRVIPGPLLAVIWGVGFNQWALLHAPEWSLNIRHLVSLPELGSTRNFLHQLQLPDFTAITNPKIYSIALTLAIVASLETLLSVEAVDKLDPHKRVSPTNHELRAQGLGNIICGMLGGLPLTAVIVRSAANVNAGGQTRISSFFHGVLLAVSVVFFAHYLNLIPLACLAAILLQTGYKLAKPMMFFEFYRKGISQFVPFTITVFAILFTDLLEGIAIGMACGIFFVLWSDFHSAMTLTQHGSHYLLRLHKDVSFLNKALLRKHLAHIKDDSVMIIDGSRALFIDQDIMETIADFLVAARDRNIEVDLQGFATDSPLLRISSSPTDLALATGH
ncbi:MAG: SulP family inorganic anion transporter [Methylomonas sp.]|jgi:MFS superfamily sulfate permease-like transporter|uniref:SulP family inorganic anion transporter n=1 Tax=Methylomonas sp. TaxID=418 RepID=UPI0025CB8DC4|nr:SulP family inorganic anion transporter [Methylomonas sp.]MCK9609148.1 SulP family inorganic anion transporter [Methylomonas sp.]